MTEELQIRVHGDAALPTLIYLPGLHGDWTLMGGLRAALAGQVRFVEFTYPRTLTWSLDDYASAVVVKLLESGITRGWLLGESFGSQIVWPLVQEGRAFHVDGAVLAGGFVRHPWVASVRRAQKRFGRMTLERFTGMFAAYFRFSRFRHRRLPEIMEGLQEFLARRTEADKAAMTQRLGLIANNDPRPLARAATLPVWHLTGAFDPIVPWLPVQWWLRRNCPGYRGSRVVWLADHNVLATAFRESAGQITRWMRDGKRN